MKQNSFRKSLDEGGRGDGVPKAQKIDGNKITEEEHFSQTMELIQALCLPQWDLLERY